MADETVADVRKRVEALLASNLDDDALLRELKALSLAREQEFAQCADLWAPALYTRDATFFGPFLQGYLSTKQAEIIKALLARAEADGQDTLFTDLYPKIAGEATWHAELAALAKSPQPDEIVLKAVRRRDVTTNSFFLREDTAAALYRRNPALFADFVQAHVGRGWGKQQRLYKRLREEVHKRGDEDLYWTLFREFATEEEWKANLRQLLARDIPTGAVADELEKRHPVRLGSPDTRILAGFVEKYGRGVLPYIEAHLSSAPADFLSRIQKLGDDALYWSIFFQAGNAKLWNEALRQLLTHQLSDDQLAAAIHRCTPPEQYETSWQLERDIALSLYQRSADVFRPFLERFVEGGMAALELPKRIEAALAASSDRGMLLRELEGLSHVPGFDECAGQWATALYARDPLFFEPFLLSHLDSGQTAVIKSLLPRIEAAEQDTLFAGLYRRIAEEKDWNAELAVLAKAPQPDGEVAKAVRRRDISDTWFSLAESTAAALFRRNPSLFAPFIREHVRRRGWGRAKQQTYKELRKQIQEHGDDDLYWALFRELADEEEWKAEMRQLLARGVPPEVIAAELVKRHPTHLWEVDTSILLDFLEKYGRSVLPYIEEHLSWISRRAAPKLLSRLQKLGDEALYWPIFFKAGSTTLWNKDLRELLDRPLADDELAAAIRLRTPPPARWNRWWLENDVALGLYRRDPATFRPFLERFVSQPDLMLVTAAEDTGDEEFLDFLSLRLMRQVSGLLHSAFPPASAERYQKPDPKSRDKVEQLGQLLTSRFDRLAAQSPETYVRHAANMLSRFEPYEVWSFKREVMLNPSMIYLFGKHREAWRASPDAMRELLESPNIYVQILGLTMLQEGDAQAAARVLENLPILRALLLGRAHVATKRAALRCLERAASQGGAFAERLLPVLEEALHFSGKRAIDERVMVAFVRLRRQLAASQSQVAS